MEYTFSVSQWQPFLSRDMAFVEQDEEGDSHLDRDIMQPQDEA